MLDHQVLFFKEIFFPELEKRKINYIIHPGDLVDRRKYVNFHTLKVMRESFLEPIQRAGYSMDLLTGNHDVYYKSTNELNALKELLEPYSNIRVWSEPGEINIGNLGIAYIPWINAENEDATHKLIKKTKAQICIGHLELRGFEMFRGQLSEHGMEGSVLDKFDMVFSGHFHQKSSRENITYLGAPYQMTWSDWDCPRGFHIFDTETRELEFIANPNELFVKLQYNDSNTTYERLMSLAEQDFGGSYIKIIVESKTNPFYFDKFLTKVEKSGPADVRIVEPLEQSDNSEIVSQAVDTQTILMNTIDRLDMDIDKKKLKTLMQELYTEALNIEVDA